MKGVMRFGKKGKLSPQYIGPYRIAKRIDNVAYELELPQELAAVHPVFHWFSLLRSAYLNQNEDIKSVKFSCSCFCHIAECCLSRRSRDSKWLSDPFLQSVF